MQSNLYPFPVGSQPSYGGTSQNTRLLAALDPTSAPVDDRSESEMLVWAAGFSEMVNFFNRENQIEGDWGEFFAAEPIVQYALMDMQDLELQSAVLGEQLRAWQNTLNSEIADLAEGNLLTLLFAQCQRINRWQVFFAQHAEEHVFASAVDSAIELKLSLALNTAQQWEKAVAEKRQEILRSFKLENDLSSFDQALWRVGMGPYWQPLKEQEEHKEVDWLKCEVPGVLVAAYQAEVGLVKAGRVRLQALLAAPRQLAPHFALFRAFVRQMRQHAQAVLNDLTGQHLHLFFRKVLEDEPAPATPDHAYVALGMAQGAVPFQLSAGTKLTTKDASGQPAVYGLNEPLDIAGNSIAQLLTSRMWPVPTATAAAEESNMYLRCTQMDPQAKQPWPMFGLGPEAAVTENEVGFAIASPSLYLEGGLRTVTLTICFGLAEAQQGLIIGTDVALTKAKVNVVYSGAKAWVTSSGGTFSLCASGQMQVVATVVIVLQPEDPPWVMFDPKVQSGTFDPGSAVLKIVRSQWSQMKHDKLSQCESAEEAFLWLMGGAEVVSIEVAVAVCEAPMQSLANNQEPLAPGGGTLPFGSAPAVRSACFFSCPELQEKLLLSATLHLYWKNLPLDSQLYPHGLMDYYGAYAVSLLRAHPKLTPPPFSRDAYQVEVDGKVNGAWQSLSNSLGPDGQLVNVLPLFNRPKPPSQSSSSHACPARASNAKDPTQLKSAYDLGSPPVTTGSDAESIGAETDFVLCFDPILQGPLPELDGSFRVQLQQPSYAFGHAIYPQVMTNVVMQNAETMMTLAQLDMATPEQIFERWRIPKPPVTAKPGLKATPAHLNPPTVYQFPGTLFTILRGTGLKRPAVFPEGVTSDQVVTALLGLENQIFANRSELDKLIIDNIYPSPAPTPPAPFPLPLPWPGLLGDLLQAVDRWIKHLLNGVALLLTPPPPAPLPAAKLHADLLLAIYRWIDRLLGEVPALLPLPPPPLTPSLSGAGVSYTASFTVSFVRDGRPDHCHQILPFATPRLLTPKGRVRALMECESGGCLYVGLVNVAAGQKVSLLWVLQDQRSDAEVDTPVWSVLCQEGWVSCTAESGILKDQTYGLQKSGLVQVAIPAEMDDRSPLMPPGPSGLPICWLRIQSQRPASFPGVVQILPQAGVVTYLPDAANGQAAAHFSQPLPAGSLKALQQPDPRVKSILQPLPSFGGRAVESEREFLTRVSERLRHKGRAWTAWDYERLLLQQFPGIYYVRCLPHTCAPYRAPAWAPLCAAFPDPTRAPGYVHVMVLPLLARAPGALPPGFTTAELKEMECWLLERASPAVQLRVCNPVYEKLRLTVAVVFDDSQPVGTVQARLNAELREFISPWVYQPQNVALPTFEFHLATLRAFIQARPYVKSLSDCTCEVEGQCSIVGDWIRPSNAWSQLITAEEHVFNPPPTSS